MSGLQKTISRRFLHLVFLNIQPYNIDKSILSSPFLSRHSGNIAIRTVSWVRLTCEPCRPSSSPRVSGDQLSMFPLEMGFLFEMGNVSIAS